MQDNPNHRFSIRAVQPEEFSALGQMIVAVYSNVPGMPTPKQAPDYYGLLRDVARRAGNPAISVLAAVDEYGQLLGSVDFIDDMRHYGSGGTADSVPDAAGIRLLAVAPESRGLGVGKALARYCVVRAAELGKSKVILHTTRSMQTAWSMYERMGFERFPEIDLRQGDLDIYGFRLDL
jgi:ribosomal protein S18 acetylase RimI-like enzyme